MGKIAQVNKPAHGPRDVIDGDETVLGRLGNLEVGIASCEEEILQAKQLRYKVFKGDTGLATGEIDEDHFDAFCKHLVVREFSQSDETKIVATYRLLDADGAKRAGGFYSAGEFELEPLFIRKSGLKFLEFGRSCVLPQYRTKRTVELLWHGSWAYVLRYGFDVMFGCASFEGCDVARHQESLDFIACHVGAPTDWDVRAKKTCRVETDASAGAALTGRAALKSLPALIKGYMRLGACFATQAAKDAQFDTIDVLVILPIDRLNDRYVNYYGHAAERHSAS